MNDTQGNATETAQATVGEALTMSAKAASLAVETAQGMMEDNDARRQTIEDVRSIRRNRNRLYMLLAGFFMALAWPVVCTALGLASGKQWTSAIAVTGDLAVTAYALIKRY